jgi:hypothetical protein
MQRCKQMQLSRKSIPLFLTGASLCLLALWAVSAGRPQQKSAESPGPLSKAHSSLEGPANCLKCHERGPKIDPKRCLSCHQTIAARIEAKKGVHRDVSGDCEACHQEHQGVDVDLRPLDPQDFDHAAETGFPLEGKHAALANNCAACHQVRSYLANQPACSSCHADPHQGGMTQACATCHKPEAWRSVSRAFHKTGIFPLEGRHLEVPCASCHLNGVYKGTPIRCYDCHWIRREDDRYQTKLGSECEECHRPISWIAVNWDHASRTGLALSGEHRTLSCDSCHKDKNFQGGSFACFSCHREDYERASSPNHIAAGFPTGCEFCHLPSHSDWDQARFDHNSSYPLVGVHTPQSCAACHKNNMYAGTPRDCYGCHRGDYEQTRDPNHVAVGFPTSCEVCHRISDADWDQARFDHNSSYPLVGVHTTQSCAACHKNNIYAGTPRDCYGCHRADYEQTRNPNHITAGFPTSCETCHRASDGDWDQARLDHNSIYPLVGVHATQACVGCHNNNVYKGTPRDCYGCHRTNYEQTRDPNHISAGFPTSCETCHRASDTSWNQGRFNHTWFPITSGRHAGRACSDCHPERSSYEIFTCLTCHDRNNTDGDHRGVSGYSYNSPACYSCHPQGRE